MDLSALRLFVQVVESRSLSGAARVLGLNQPAASRALARLEAELGARLLHRTTRSLSLTEAGGRAYAHALAVLEEHEALRASVRGADRAPAGLLRISASVAFTRAELIPAAPSLLAAYPDLRLDFAAEDERIDLAARAVDLAFRLGALPDSELTATLVGRYDRCLVASPEFAAMRDPPAQPEDLGDWPAVQFTSAPFGSRWTLRSPGRSTDVAMTGLVRASSGEVVLDLVLAGLGVALLPAFVVRAELASGALVRVLPEWSGPPLPLHALWTSGRSLSRKARVFIDHLRPRLALSAAATA